ncbi:MAG: DASH family cryptochrome [Pseudomonadota bacterium]
MKPYSSGLFCFSDDLRVNDNAALTLAQQQCQQLSYCYVIDKTALVRGRYGIPALGKHRLNFILQSLQQLRVTLNQQGHSLAVYVGEPLEILTALTGQYQFDAIFSGERAGVYEQRRWQKLQDRFRFLNFHQVSNFTLFNEARLPLELEQLPSTFSKFRKLLEPLSQSVPADGLAAPDFNHHPLLLPSHQDLPSIDPDLNTLVKGGEHSAQQHLQDYFASAAPHSYKETRNALDGFSNSTKLSAYLARGNLSPQQVVNAVRSYEQQYGENDSTYWIIFELLWREYFYWYLQRYQEHVFSFQGLAKQKPQTSFYPTRFKHWCEGKTPYPLVNACMKQLNSSGYISNRGRQIVASCLVHELSVDWRYGAAYFEQQLVDYDVGANWGNWQYIAGVGADPRGGRRFNIDKQSKIYDPDNRFTDHWGGSETSAVDHVDAADWPTSG